MPSSKWISESLLAVAGGVELLAGRQASGQQDRDVVDAVAVGVALFAQLDARLEVLAQIELAVAVGVELGQGDLADLVVAPPPVDAPVEVGVLFVALRGRRPLKKTQWSTLPSALRSAMQLDGLALAVVDVPGVDLAVAGGVVLGAQGLARGGVEVHPGVDGAVPLLVLALAREGALGIVLVPEIHPAVVVFVELDGAEDARAVVLDTVVFDAVRRAARLRVAAALRAMTPASKRVSLSKKPSPSASSFSLVDTLLGVEAVDGVGLAVARAVLLLASPCDLHWKVMVVSMRPSPLVSASRRVGCPPANAVTISLCPSPSSSRSSRTFWPPM